MSPDGLRAGAQALRYWERRQEVISNNLANASTHGFRGERVFAALLADGTVAPQAKTDWRPGQLTRTGNPLDIALEGEGFLVVRTEQGERLVRGGSFRQDAQGRLVDANGGLLLDESGMPVVLPPGTVDITRDGSVMVDGRTIATLRVVAPADLDAVLHDGANRFRTDAVLLDVAPEMRRVLQGSLEESNVETLQTMVEMITVQRNYAAVQSTMKVVDNVNGTIANQIGRVS